jgi:hypothetical protein
MKWSGSSKVPEELAGFNRFVTPVVRNTEKE